MRYTLLYHYDPIEAGPGEDEVPQWLAFDEQVRQAGAFVYEAGFHPAEQARTVSVRDEQVATDPGAVVGASGEVLAGFYVVDVPDEQAAREWAERIPTAAYGKVEVRPVVEFG